MSVFEIARFIVKFFAAVLLVFSPFWIIVIIAGLRGELSDSEPEASTSSYYIGKYNVYRKPKPKPPIEVKCGLCNDSGTVRDFVGDLVWCCCPRGRTLTDLKEKSC